MLPVPLANLDQEDNEEDDDEDEDNTASTDGSKYCYLGAEESITGTLSFLAILVNRTWDEGRGKEK